MQHRPITLFLVITLVLSAIFWVLIISAGHVGAAAGRYVTGLMWCPGVAALIVCSLPGEDVGSLGLGWGRTRYVLLGYAVPLAYASVAYCLIWLLGLGGFPDMKAIASMSAKLQWSLPAAAFIPLYFLLQATTGIIPSVAHALGEEIGWRGFLTPRLVGALGFTRGVFVIGVIWTAWHVPILLFADYNSGTPWWYALPCFLVLVVSISFPLAWLRLRSGSVWPCAMLHASHNLFIQAFFTPLTAARGAVTPYVVDEFGIALPLVAIGCAVLFWRRRGLVVV